ncbi:MAG: hypothetical protein WAU47_05645 [Desulfobaccales bacterium]
MKWRHVGWGLLLIVLGGCAGRGLMGAGDTLGVGQRVEDLVARQGQPQEIQPGPGGGKTYVYTTANLDQTAAMGGGAWVKPDQVHYRLNDQGVITNVKSIFLQWREDTKKKQNQRILEGKANLRRRPTRNLYSLCPLFAKFFAGDQVTKAVIKADNSPDLVGNRPGLPAIARAAYQHVIFIFQVLGYQFPFFGKISAFKIVLRPEHRGPGKQF